MQDDDFGCFTNLLARAAFWRLPNKMPEDGGGCDGSREIIEVVKDGQYHLVDWWSPYSGAYYLATLQLMRLGFVEHKDTIPPAFFFPEDDNHTPLDFDPRTQTSQIDSWKTKEDVISALGLPHEAETTPQRTTWSYFLRNREKLILVFDREGKITGGVLVESHYFAEEMDNKQMQNIGTNAPNSDL